MSEVTYVYGGQAPLSQGVLGEMLVETRKTIHMGVNFVMAPMPPIDDPRLRLGIQSSLDQAGVAYSTVKRTENELIISRDEPTRLEVKIALFRPAVPPVGQLLILAPFPERSLDAFIEEAEIVIRAFESASPPAQRQLISRDATLRDLYETGGVHAFQEIWETVLEQRPEALQKLGREVLGGGLRLVMPPRPDDQDPVNIELKIESYLKDTTKIFLEAQFSWQRPLPPGMEASPRYLLGQVEEYITRTALDFIGAER
jgi:hypothetical protein